MSSQNDGDGQLAFAQQLAAFAEDLVNRQRRLVDALRARGEDCTVAEQLLSAFESALAVHLANVQRLQNEAPPD